MTKEWQEASEEYLKVRSSHDLVQTCLMIIYVLTQFYRPRVPSPSPDTRACWCSRSRRRTFLLARSSTTSKPKGKSSTSNAQYQYQYQYHISLGQISIWYCLCQIYNHIGRVTSLCWIGPCHISHSVYRNLRGICDFCLIISTMVLCVEHRVRLQSSPIYALFSPVTDHCIVRPTDKLRIASSGLGKCR